MVDHAANGLTSALLFRTLARCLYFALVPSGLSSAGNLSGTNSEALAVYTEGAGARLQRMPRATVFEEHSHTLKTNPGRKPAIYLNLAFPIDDRNHHTYKTNRISL